MLVGIDPLLSGDLLRHLANMGHGDTVAVVDANYPAYSAGRDVVELGAVSVHVAVAAILSVFPLDTFEPSLFCMEPAQDSPTPPLSHRQVLEAAAGRGFEGTLTAIDRPAFYVRARAASVIVHTLDRRLYGCFLLQKGIVNE